MAFPSFPPSALALALAASTLLASAFTGLAPPAAAFTPAEAQAPMTVTLVRGDAPGCGDDRPAPPSSPGSPPHVAAPACPEWLAMTGKIGFDTPGRLAAALARLGKRRVPVLLDSPGGESLAALAMARTIRARGLDTAVATTTLVPCDAADGACRARERGGERAGHLGPAPGVTFAPVCASACVLMLAGGADRDVPPGAFVGVHQVKRVLTFHPVMNTFRVLSRVVGGRKVEVSRTLVATRAMPVRVVTGAAPQSLYDELERTLIGLGVDESIVPLMRATPPSGIHWMTTAELASTRISTDTAAAATLVAREAEVQAEVQAAANKARDMRLDAALTLQDGRRWKGTVAWRVDAASSGAPALAGDWEIPERRLRGSVALAADAAPASPSSFRLVTRYATDRGGDRAGGRGADVGSADAARILAVRAPQLCGPSDCIGHFAGPTAFDRPTASFDVARGWRTDFLGHLHRRDWLSIPVRTDDGWGWIALALASPDASEVATWERLCCGFAAADWPWMEPPSRLPAFPARPDVFLIGRVAPVRPAPAGPAPGRGGPIGSRTLVLPALYDAAPAEQHGFPARVAGGSLTWFPLVAPAAMGGPGTTALLGAAELSEIGLRVSIEAGPSAPGVLGRITVRLHILTERPEAFGPVAGMTAVISYDDQGHPLLLPDKVETVGGGGKVVFLDVPETGPVAGAFQLGFADAKGRRATVALPIDPPTAALLQAASRQNRTGGS